MTKKIWLGVIIFIVIIGATYGVVAQWQSDTDVVQQNVVTDIDHHALSAELVVFDTEHEIYRKNIIFDHDITVLDLMKEAGLDLEIKEYSFGVAIEVINGINQNDTDGKYWLLYVNDAMAQEGASTFIVHSGDVIEWRLE